MANLEEAWVLNLAEKVVDAEEEETDPAALEAARRAAGAVDLDAADVALYPAAREATLEGADAAARVAEADEAVVREAKAQAMASEETDRVAQALEAADWAAAATAAEEAAPFLADAAAAKVVADCEHATRTQHVVRKMPAPCCQGACFGYICDKQNMCSCVARNVASSTHRKLRKAGASGCPGPNRPESPKSADTARRRSWWSSLALTRSKA